MKKASERNNPSADLSGKPRDTQAATRNEPVRKAQYGTAGNLTSQHNRNRDSEVRSSRIIRYVAWVLIAISIVGLIVVNFSGVGLKDSNVCVAFCDFDYDAVLPNSFVRALSKANFEAEIVDLDTVDAVMSYYGKTPLVIVTTGEKALETVAAFSDQSSVIGFVLINPVYPGNMHMSEFGKDYPTQDVAIFMPKDDSRTISDLPDGKLIYERLSGDDTLYGNRIVHDSSFSSTVFISANQRRYLSVSAFDNMEDSSVVLLNPVFENEFVQYLCTAYYDSINGDYSPSMVFVDYLLIIIFIIIGICGLLLYMFGATKVFDKDNRRRFVASRLSLADIPKRYRILVLSAVGLFVVFMLISVFVLRDNRVLSCVIAVIPIIASLIQYGIVAESDTLVNAESIVARDISRTEPLIMLILQPVLLFWILFTLMGNSLQTKDTVDYIVMGICILIDFIVCSKRSKYSFAYGRKILVGVVLFAFVLIASLILNDISLMITAISLLMLVLVPDFIEGNMRRLTRKTRVYSLAHLLSYAIIVMFLV